MSTQFRSPSGRFYEWTKLIERAKQYPGREMLLLPDTPARVLNTIRYRQHRRLRVPGGHLEAAIEHEYVDQDGTHRGDVYLTWVYDTPTPTTTKE